MFIQGGITLKGVVAFDSVHGNTKRVAEAIAEELTAAGHQVEVLNLKEQVPLEVTGDIMFIGSPTRVGKMTRQTRDFIENLDTGKWSGRTIVAFDTVGPLSKDPAKREQALSSIGQSPRTAAHTIQEVALSRGLTISPEAMHIAVVGMWGPLAPDALDMAKQRTRHYLEQLK